MYHHTYNDILYVCCITLSLIIASLLCIRFAQNYTLTIELFLFSWITIICYIFGFFCELSFIFWIPNQNFIGYAGILSKFFGDIFIYKLYYIFVPFCFVIILDAIESDKK